MNFDSYEVDGFHDEMFLARLSQLEGFLIAK